MLRDEVLESLHDGVIIVGAGGAIELVNPAAERILGISAGEVAGRGFGEAFIAREGLDELTEVMLEAVQGTAHGVRRAVTLRAGAGEGTKLVSAVASYLQDDGSGRRAVICVFSDVTELRDLQHRELEMAREAERQHERLQEAYREIEERNEALTRHARRVQRARVAATAIVIAVFLGAGAFALRPPLSLSLPPALNPFAPGRTGAAGGAGGEVGADGEPRTVTARAGSIESLVVLSAALAPWREVRIESPLGGRVDALHVAYGQSVAAGEPLVEFDRAELERSYGAARLAYLERAQALERLEAWATSPDVATARRALGKATIELDNRTRQLARTTILLREGLIAAKEHEEAKRQLDNQRLDVEAAEEELATVLAQGGEQAVAAARLEVAAAGARMERLARDRDHAVLSAPNDGVVLNPARGERAVAVGRSYTRGDLVLSLGDFERMAAHALADEIDVVRITEGQRARVRGYAFPGLLLQGRVERAAWQAEPVRGAPQYQVVVILDPFQPGERERLRPGMSCRIEIVVYRNPNAVLVPVDAVRRRGGEDTVTVWNEAAGEREQRTVTAGETTLREVEIVAGLAAGEQVIVEP